MIVTYSLVSELEGGNKIIVTTEKDLMRLKQAEVWELAKKEGILPLFDDGIEKVKSGLTTLEELLRVASPSS